MSTVIDILGRLGVMWWWDKKGETERDYQEETQVGWWGCGELVSLWPCRYRSRDADSRATRGSNNPVKTTNSHLEKDGEGWKNTCMWKMKCPVKQGIFYVLESHVNTFQCQKETKVRANLTTGTMKLSLQMVIEVMKHIKRATGKILVIKWWRNKSYTNCIQTLKVILH